MAIDHNRVILLGSTTGGETWSTSCAYSTNFGTGPVKDFSDLLAWATAIGALNSGNVVGTAMVSFLSDSMQIDTVRTEYIDSQGTIAQVAEYALPAPVTGSADASSPPQVAAVTSLLTGRPGRSYRGRMYWPHLYGALTDGQLGPTDAQNLATQMATFLGDAGEAAGTDFAMVPVVYSTVLGTVSFVTTVRVDTVLDTQRRRRNSLRGTSYTATV